MTFPDTAVRTAVFAILNAADIKAFDQVAPSNAPVPYVLLLGQESTDYSTKNGYGFTHSLTLSAVDVTTTPTGRSRAEGLLSQVLSLLTRNRPDQPEKIQLPANEFRLWMTKASKPKDLVAQGNTATVYQKIVTLEFSIEAA